MDIFWQKNAWVDGHVVHKFVTKFVQAKKEKHGDDWVILFADNLSAHLLPEVKKIRRRSCAVNIFPPSMIEMVQPIDAGYGRPLRSAIGRELDAWIMNGK